MNSFILRIHHEAQEDIDAAYGWYFEQSPDTAQEFLDALEIYYGRIISRPLAYALYSRRARRAVMARFPYAIIFQQKIDGILILALAHAKRNPGYWESRI